MNGTAHVVSLPSNYRCTPEIVRMAVSTLATDGQIADAESRRSIGEPVVLQRCSTETDETAFITKSVLRAKSGRSWNDIAVLVRVNAVADQVREELSKVGVPIRSSRRGGAWARAVAAATDLTGRESLSAWAAEISSSQNSFASFSMRVVSEQLMGEHLDRGSRHLQTYLNLMEWKFSHSMPQKVESGPM
jgi:hypothetical protein